MEQSLEQVFNWFRTVGQKNHSLLHQVEQYPNDGVQVLHPILAHDREFSPKLHNPNNESPLLHCHEGFALLYMYKGSCLTSINETPLMLNQGDILLLSPQVMHRNSLVHPEDWMFHCQISRNFLTQMLFPIASDDVLLSSFILDFIGDASVHQYLYFPGLGNSPDVKSAFEEILKEYVFRKPFSRPLIRCKLAYFFTLLACKSNQNAAAAPGASDQFSKILDYISQNYSHTTLRQMAEDFHYHPNYLSALIRQKTGKSFSELIQSHRLSRACFLLDHSSFSTEEIAFQVGYKDISSFYKAYKRRFGTSPRMGNKPSDG